MVRGALRGSAINKVDLRGYEIWTPMAEAHRIEDISKVMPRKLRAIRAHRSQVAQIDYALAIQGLNQYRGEITGKMRFAEAFEMLPLKAD
jgi:LmbE family N-acetylglucosaminyl deacetylase